MFHWWVGQYLERGARALPASAGTDRVNVLDGDFDQGHGCRASWTVTIVEVFFLAGLSCLAALHGFLDGELLAADAGVRVILSAAAVEDWRRK